MLDRVELRLLGTLLLIAAAVDLLLFELGIWKEFVFDGESGAYAKLIPIGFAWAIAIIVLATLPLVATSRRVRLSVVPAVGACAIVGATVATALVWRDLDSTGWAKTLAVIAILMVAGYLLTPLVERLARAQRLQP